MFTAIVIAVLTTAIIVFPCGMMFNHWMHKDHFRDAVSAANGFSREHGWRNRKETPAPADNQKALETTAKW